MEKKNRRGLPCPGRPKKIKGSGLVSGRSGRRRLPPPASGGPSRGAICSPLPAKPCGSVPGSKIFTEIPRRHLPPATPVGATSPAKPYITVGSRQQGAPNPTRRRPMLAPPRRQPLVPPSGHANKEPPRSNRNLVGIAGTKAKNKPSSAISTEN